MEKDGEKGKTDFIERKHIESIRDITDSKLVEEQLTLSNQRIALHIQHTPLACIEFDLEGRVRGWNPAAIKIFGFPREEAIGQYWTFIVPREVWSSLDGVWEALVKQQGGSRSSNENITKKGQKIRCEWYNAPLIDPDGKTLGVTSLVMDITARKRAEQELILAKEKAEESDRLKSAFLANVSHEIRTPMNGILGFAGLLKEPGLTGDDQQEYISIIEKSGARMLNIINDIVDISKIESGQMKVFISETNANELIEFVYAFFKPEAENKGIQLSIKNSLPFEEVILQTDREKLYSILTNLVKNAIKYTHEGSIELGYTREETHNCASLLQFFVKDTGIGIPKDRQHAIFDRFVQADIADKQAFQGAGLGLAISKAYVEMLGGKIRVESDPEGKSGRPGSTFYFTIPLKAEPEEKTGTENVVSSDSTVNPTNPEVPGLKILIVEDDEMSELFLRKAIKLFSKEILSTKTGVEAIEACHNNPDIDLILMDIKMPVMDGYEATRQIRQFNKGVIIIAQTAFGLTGDREKAMDAGCNDYISKPIKKDQLMGLMQKYF